MKTSAIFIFFATLVVQLSSRAEEPAYLVKLGAANAKERRDAVEEVRKALLPNFDEKTQKMSPPADAKYKPQIKAAMLKLLDDPDAEVQGAALEMLAIEFGKEVADIEDKVLSLTTSKSVSVRKAALKYFDQQHFYRTPKTPHEKLGEIFLAALSDPDPEIRGSAPTTALTYHGGDDKLVAALTRLLKDPEVNVKAMAIYALSQCPDLPAETMTAILAQKDDPAEIMKEVYTHMTPVFMRKTGPQRWQSARVVRSNPYGLGRVWIEVDRALLGGTSWTVVVSASGSIPTQYAPVPNQPKDVPIDMVWFSSGNAVALIYAKDVADSVLFWDDGALASAADTAGVQFINPQHRPMTDADRDALKLGSKEDYLKKIAAARAKREPQRRFVLWPSGKLRSEWHVYEADDGTYVADGDFAVWLENGQQNEKGSYKDSKPDGRIQEWDANGGIVTDGIWVAGKPQSGLCRDLADGRKIKQFRDGVVVTTDADKK